MQFDAPLLPATLIRRYKRFLADVRLENGETLTVHCPNTGTMLSCSTPGSPVRLSISDNPKRKYPHTLEMVRDNGTWVGVNTSRTNKLVIEAIQRGLVPELSPFDAIRAEVKTSAGSRLDLMVSRGEKRTYVEIKNCSLAENGCAMFPDAKTVRGTKHLNELIRLKNEGHQTCIFFLVQRMDADRFSPASHIDPVYGETLMKANREGVQILVYQAEVTPEEITVVRNLPHDVA
ncbi:sugar fermentation stimulation protein [Desulfomarina profundi]|uniref:Sugar fermentation stimulation protein homolog n=1 Tax=Desulfomarina profundi TaxID=2772557 RepID=A0A8D5FKJ1_9BACT|nr:DNA/RNA nuclease SfsA [Desulfomarina profundi]BCL62281.1 sugar fermentation stimulation protein [Desulfomarina profundi]